MCFRLGQMGRGHMNGSQGDFIDTKDSRINPLMFQPSCVPQAVRALGESPTLEGFNRYVDVALGDGG